MAEQRGRPKILLRRHVLEVKEDTREWVEELLVPQVNKSLASRALAQIDPIRLAAVAGLAVVLKPVVAGSSDLLGWYGKLFDGLGLAISGNFTPDVAADILFNVPFVGGLYRALYGAFLPEDLPTEPINHNEVLEWMLAISAASLIVILGPSAIGLIGG